LATLRHQSPNPPVFEKSSGILWFFGVANLHTLQGTNISHLKVPWKMIFLFHTWDMLVPRRVYLVPPRIKRKQSKRCRNFKSGIPLPGLRLKHRIYPSAFLQWVLGYNKNSFL